MVEVTQMENITLGRTKARVMRKEVNEQNGRETVKEIHRGIIVAHTNRFAQVYNPNPQNKGGDVSPQTAELFPFKGSRCWIEPLGEVDERRAVVVPAELRN
jgi:hypothetical protein